MFPKLWVIMSNSLYSQTHGRWWWLLLGYVTRLDESVARDPSKYVVDHPWKKNKKKEGGREKKEER